MLTVIKHLTSIDWGPDEPNNTEDKEDCCCIYVNEGYHWNDVNCEEWHNYPICETE